MTFQLPKVYPITDKAISGLSHAEQVKRLIAGGARLIQLRDKHASSRDLYREALEVLEIAANTGCKIVINDRVDIAYTVGAAGVHLGQDDLPAAIARKILGPDSIIGLSTHTLAQALAGLSAPVDYIAIGPIFETDTKARASTVVGTAEITKVKAAIGPTPLVAIGGINCRNLTQVFAAGADSAAIISDILQDPDRITQQMRIAGNTAR